MADQLRLAAEADLPTAIYLFAVLTEQGAGVKRDPVRAVPDRRFGGPCR